MGGFFDGPAFETFGTVIRAIFWGGFVAGRFGEFDVGGLEVGGGWKSGAAWKPEEAVKRWEAELGVAELGKAELGEPPNLG
jgi:hypothetical protein